MENYIKLLRPAHWIKNGLIFVPIVFAGRLFTSQFFQCLLGFVAFSLISSAVYVVNDIFDVQNDKLHDVKSKRPIASGKISRKNGVFAACLLISLSIAVNFFVCNYLVSFIVITIYLILNILYSVGLKNIPLADLLILSSGFILRVIYGGEITDMPISNWLYIVVVSFSFFIGLGKRRNEIITGEKQSREVLTHYTRNFLDKNMYVCFALTIMFYTMWCLDSATIPAQSREKLIFTMPLILIIFMRYSMNIEKEQSGDPIEILLRDKILQVLISLYGLILFCVLYASNI